MIMSKWTDNQLDLGHLMGYLEVENPHGDSEWFWGWYWHGGSPCHEEMRVYPSPSKARRAAEGWMRKALKQAGASLKRTKGVLF